MKTGQLLGGIALGGIIGLTVGFQIGVRSSTDIRNTMREDVSTKGGQIAIVCSTRDLDAGTLITSSDLTLKRVVESTVSPRRCIHAEDAPKLLGRKLVFSVKSGESMMWPDIESRSTDKNDKQEDQRTTAN